MRELKYVSDLSLLHIALLRCAPYETPWLFTNPHRSLRRQIDQLIDNGYLERDNSTASYIYVVRRTLVGDHAYFDAELLLKEHDARRKTYTRTST